MLVLGALALLAFTAPATDDYQDHLEAAKLAARRSRHPTQNSSFFWHPHNVSSQLVQEHRNVKDGIGAVKDLMKRVLPPGLDAYFDLVLNPSLSADKDAFSLSKSATAGHITITATNAASLASGLGWYLKYWCNASVTWSGRQMSIPFPLPQITQPVTVVSAVKYRYYLNTCTHSYTMAWWDWSRWEQEIDWLALQGFNMVLAFTGQEYVWAQVFQNQFGFSDAEIQQWFTGPAFLAWGRMGNIRGYGGPLSKNWMRAQFDLQQNILSRLRALDIIAVLPAFAGHVPPSFSTRYPNARVSNLPTWAGFNSTFSGDFVLDATDPMFAQISKAVLQAQQTLYNGTDHVYNADTYNEMIPASNDTDFLTAQSQAVYQSFAAQDPQAIWMIQGWMFSFDRDFWQPTQIKAYLKGVPDDKMIILDLNAYADPIWKETDSFYGKQFIWCIIQNGGQRPGMYGNLDKVTNDIAAAQQQAASMVGVGVAPEGLYINYVMYELTAEMGWRSAAVDTDTWLDQFVSRTYYPAPPSILEAWRMMKKFIYTSDVEDYFMFSSRPSMTMGSGSDWTNVTAVVEIWRLFHQSAGVLSSNPIFRFDYIDLTRQTLAFLFEDLYFAFVKAFDLVDVASMHRLGGALVELVMDIDRALETNELWMVGPWISDAVSWAANDNEAQVLEYNARHLISIWGPNGELNSYAMRHFAGMVSDIHAARWKLFVSEAIKAAQSQTQFPQSVFDSEAFYKIEKPWAEAINIYPSVAIGDTASTIDELFQKYAGNWTMNQIQAEYQVFAESDGTGTILNGFQTQTTDFGQIHFICNLITQCGGFSADGTLKPWGSQPIRNGNATFFQKKLGSSRCPPGRLCRD